MKQRRGVVIETADFDSYWVDLAARAGLNVLGLHPAPFRKPEDPLSAEAMFELIKTDRFKASARDLSSEGIELEFELHAMHILLPRTHFMTHPEWFRQDETGARNPDLNYCPSREEPTAIVETNAAWMAEQLAPFMTGHRFFLWIDDAGKYCQCDDCKKLTVSDQALIMHNAIMRGIKRADPKGQSAYLAYQETIPAPKLTKAEPGLFVEYAPIFRDSGHAMDEVDNEKNAAEGRHIGQLLDFFGSGGSQVLEYWLDNSRFHSWKRPFGEMPYYRAVLQRDVEFYKSFGFETLTSFAVGLNRDYERKYGEPPVIDYGQLLRGKRTI
jgi:hypothetical protein